MKNKPNPLWFAVFDCDGTLVDSQQAIVQTMQRACSHHEFPCPAEPDIKRVIGLPLEVAIDRLLKGIDNSLALDICATYKSAFSDLRQANLVSEPLYAGVADVLDQLENDGWVLGIATGKSHRGLRATLKQHDLMKKFVTHQTADSAFGKPHPDMILKAMAASGAEPQHSVMIGDTTFDMEMACNAGITGIGVAWGYHEIDELMDAGAHGVVQNTSDLLRLLRDKMEPP